MARGDTLETWVSGADGTGFGIEHLPLGVLRAGSEPPRPAVRIGDRGLLLAPLAAAGLLDAAEGAKAEALREVLQAPSLNPLLELGRPSWSGLRTRLTELLAAGNSELADAGLSGALVALDDAEALLPVEVGDYVDFYSSIEHASNVGRLMRPDQEPLYPNWRQEPVGYHGRVANLVVSGTPIPRPVGQTGPQTPDGQSGFGPESRLDFELELGFVCGSGPEHGGPITTDAASEHIFGFLLVNDWSARSIQTWEYRPLGPFLGKAFATSLATWITPLEALEPFRIPGRKQDPAPLAYLHSDERWALDLELEVALAPAASNAETISRTSAAGLYWSAAQQLAHVTHSGAVVRAGDLFASGTISGPEPGTQGCLLELTQGGRRPLHVDGVERSFLEDGDEVVLRGAGAPGEGRPRLTLAEVTGRIAPAN
jgi:fumarylacetoacetase